MNILSVQCTLNVILRVSKLRANDIDLKDAERIDSFLGVIFNCEIK